MWCHKYGFSWTLFVFFTFYNIHVELDFIMAPAATCPSDLTDLGLGLPRTTQDYTSYDSNT